MRDGLSPSACGSARAARGALLAVCCVLALALAACGAEATPTPVSVPAAIVIPAQTAPPKPTEGAALPPASGTVGAGGILPERTAPPRLEGGDQPLPTTSPGMTGKPPTAPPGTLTLPTPVPTAPGQTLPNPEGTAGPAGADDLPPGDAQIGQPAPDFTVKRLDTGDTDKLSDFKGRPVWINFWATWCGPCKEEMPRMQAIYEAQRSTDLVILGVDFREDAATVRQFVTERGLGWTFVLDPDARAAWSYFVIGIPTHVFVNRDGTIRDIVSAGLTQTQMEQEVAAILK